MTNTPDTPDQVDALDAPQGALAHAESLPASGKQADNRHQYADITGSTGIRVNIFKDDTELDKALRLLRAATDIVDEAVSDLVAADQEAKND